MKTIILHLSLNETHLHAVVIVCVTQQLNLLVPAASDRRITRLIYRVFIPRQKELAMFRIGVPYDLEAMLSSSPPGFELNLDIRADEALAKQRQLQLATKARWYALDRTEEQNVNTVEGWFDSESAQQNTWLNEDTSRRISDWESYYDCDTTTLNGAAEEEPAPTPLSRKVSFAQHLESVLVIEESPDDPPWALYQADDDLGDDVTLDEPRLVLNFTQPAADYLTFRNTVESKFVSLANVIVKDLRVSGTVRVKNIAYEKSVVVRHTFNGWASFSDAVATHQADDDQRFDTFAFVIDWPPYQPPGSKLQFAVRYTAAGVDYWDSNRGENFEVLYVSANSAENCGQFQNTAAFSGQHSPLWSEYSVWSDIDDSSPYW